MSFPQPSSVAPVISSEQFFRLKTVIESAGDLYESEVSALAFALGPDSDLASVNVTYYDEAMKKANSLVLSPDRAFVGRINARSDVDYPCPGARKGRILISVNDMYDGSARPSGFNANDDEIDFLRPTLDVIQYFVNAPSVTPERSDKTYRFQYFRGAQNLATGVYYLAIPAYGRKSGTFCFTNRNGIATVHVAVSGWKLSTSETPGTIGSFQNGLASDDLLVGDSLIYNYDAGVDGIWDMFLIALGGGAGPFPYDPTAALPTVITLSDDPT